VVGHFLFSQKGSGIYDKNKPVSQGQWAAGIW
jgi:hypothetical protein